MEKLCSHVCTNPENKMGPWMMGEGDRTRRYEGGDLPCQCGGRHSQCAYCGAVPAPPYQAITTVDWAALAQRVRDLAPRSWSKPPRRRP